jgi:KTSC domain
MQRTGLPSRSIRSAGYDAEQQRLELEFSSGGVYEYFDVPESVYDWLLRVPNKGRYVTKMISNRYRFRVRGTDAPAEHTSAPSNLAEQLQRSVAALAQRAPKSDDGVV